MGTLGDVIGVTLDLRMVGVEMVLGAMVGTWEVFDGAHVDVVPKGHAA